MNMSRTLKRQSAFGDVKVMHVKGHFLPLSDPSPSDGSSPHPQHHQQKKYVFMATCSPLIMPEVKESLIQSNTMVFKTVHHMDMTFMEVTKTAEYHLGCSTEEICKASWYSMLHPEDIHEAREKHVLLMRATHDLGCMMTVRMLTRKGQIMWVNVVMHVRQSAANSSSPSSSSSSSSSQNGDDGVIICINQVISQEEAFQLRLQSHTFTLYPPRTTELWNNTATMMAPSQQPNAILWSTASSSSTSSSSSSPPVHHPGLSPPNPMMSSCSGLAQQHQHQQVLPPTPPSYIGGLGQSAYHHTDSLKLKLKRKLQGPGVSLPPAKMPRMAALDESPHARGRSCNGGQGLGLSAASTCSLKMSRNGSEGFSWSGSSPVMPQQAQYQVALPLASVGQNRKASTAMLSSSPSQGCLSPPLGTTAVMAGAYHSTEQVVPQSEAKGAVTVPESYLTPDSSPASSPDPQTSSNIKRRNAPASAAAVLKDLEKLPVFLQKISAAAAVVGTSSTTGLRIKTETSPGECGRAAHRRELPVMDASDIETFFHTLDCSEQFTAMEKKKKNPLPEMLTRVEENQPSLEAAATAVLTEQAQYIKIKQEPAAGAFTAASQQQQQQQQVQVMPRKAEEQPSPAQQSDELEDLLGFFAGEMTATQLNLEGLLGSPLAKEEAEKRWLQSNQWWDGQGVGGCGAGHLDPFLLHGSPLGRPHEGFGPVSPSDASGDEDSTSSGEDVLNKLDKPLASWMTEKGGEEKKMLGCSAPSPSSGPFPSPSPATPLPQASPQDVPGMEEEDELYQLDKLLSLMASNSGVMLFPDSQ